jgi:single-stranded DNA-binding protein
MSFAKAVVTGVVVRTPEKRFTQNNIAIYGLSLNLDEQEETLVRVISKRKALEGLLDRVRQGDKLLVEGKLQIATSKSPDGSEKRFFEIDAVTIEMMTQAQQTSIVSEPTELSESPSISTDEDDDDIPF